jgi:hypothetical protein
MRRAGELIPGAGEVLSITHAGARTVAVAVIRGADSPLRVGSTVQVHGSGAGLYLTVLDADASNLALGSGSLIGAAPAAP